MTAPDQPARNDNLFGVCAALGEDFGFNPIWLRLAFAVALLVDLEHVLLAYAALGLLVLVSRLAFRTPSPVPVARPAATEPASIDAHDYREAA